MGGDSIKTIRIGVEVQENGLIRAANGVIIGRLEEEVGFDNLIAWQTRPESSISGTAQNAIRPPVATPMQIANRIYNTAVHIQLELEQAQRPHDGAIDRMKLALPIIDKSLWSIRHGAVALEGIARRYEQSGGDQ